MNDTNKIPGSPEWLRDLSKHFIDETREGLRAAADCLDKIRAALDTEETGDALVEVARAAHEAEQELAAVMKLSGVSYKKIFPSGLWEASVIYLNTLYRGYGDTKANALVALKEIIKGAT